MSDFVRFRRVEADHQGEYVWLNPVGVQVVVPVSDTETELVLGSGRVRVWGGINGVMRQLGADVDSRGFLRRLFG